MMTGPTLSGLMRRHKVTIRMLAQRLAIPMTRVRRRRLQGLEEPHVVRDWVQAITGVDPGLLEEPVDLDDDACPSCGRGGNGEPCPPSCGAEPQPPRMPHRCGSCGAVAGWGGGLFRRKPQPQP